MRKFIIPLLVLSCLAARAHAYTVRVNVYQEYAWSGPLTYAAPGFQVRMCQMVNGVPSSYCSSAQSNSWGQAVLSPTQSGYFMMYVWHTSYSFVTNANFDDWGSRDQGSQVYVYPSMTDTIINWNSQPRPLPPDLKSPCNGCRIPASGVSLKWTTGIDGDRQRSSWAVTYDIYTSAAAPGYVGTPPEAKSVADASCNPDANGYCQFFAGPLDPLSGTRYTWRVVAKLHTDEGIKETSSVTKTIYQQ